jgi:ketosteroid isomerase-like protein
MTLRDDDEVRRVHQRFYRAFESLQLDQMDAVWAHDGQVVCVHPGWPPAVGWPSVRASWEIIFRNTDRIRFEVTDERIDVRGELAWVVCIELVRSGGGQGAVLATNVLRRGPDGWKLVHHHGSQFVPPQLEVDEPESESEPEPKKKVLN